jgi:hypothetical protein
MAQNEITEALTANAVVEHDALNAMIKKIIDKHLQRKSAVMAKLMALGRVSMGWAAKGIEWYPEFKRLEIRASNGAAPKFFFPQEAYRKLCQLPYRSYELTQGVSKLSMLQTRKSAANAQAVIFDTAQRLLEKMGGDFLDGLQNEFYANGHATNSRQWHGLESVFNGIVANYVDPVTGGVSVAGAPVATYAGQSTVLGRLGSWTPDPGDAWPTGGQVGTASYHWFSPLVIDYGSNKFSGTSNTWKLNWQEAISYYQMFQGSIRNASPDSLLLENKLYFEAKASLQTLQRFNVTEGNDQLTNLGHKNLTYDGLEIISEHGIPSGVGYFLVWDEIELMSMQDQLVEQTDQINFTNASKEIMMDTYSNFRFETPAFLGKLMRITALGT